MLLELDALEEVPVATTLDGKAVEFLVNDPQQLQSWAQVWVGDHDDRQVPL